MIDVDAFNDYVGYKVQKLKENWPTKMQKGILITDKDAVVEIPEDLQDYSNTPVYDMMTLEDISLADCIGKSPSNIVLKVKEQYYTFDRKVLIDYMVSKKVFVNDWIGYIFETPYRQYISSVDMSLMFYNETRIYELIDERRVPFKDGMVSIYGIMPYAVIQCLNAMLILQRCGLEKLKWLASYLTVEIMADNNTKSTSDGWGPYGPPSTWRVQFAKHNYDEHVAMWAQKLKENPGMPLPRRRTATEILEDAYRSQGYEFRGGDR